MASFPALCAAAAPDLAIRRWGPEQGLPQASVRALAQDRDGFLWVGTFGGLARFDGFQFRVVPLRGEVPLDGVPVLALLPEAGGGLWVGTDQGLARVVDGALERVPLPPPLEGTAIVALVRDSRGTLWVGSEDLGVARQAGSRFELVPGTGWGRVPLLARIQEDGDGGMVLWSSRLGPLLVTPDGPVPVPEVARDRLWNGLSPGVSSMDVRRLVLARKGSAPAPATALADLVTSVTTGPDGVEWLGGSAGLWRASGGPPVKVPLSGSPAAVSSILCDRDGAVWVGTDVEGLYQLVPRVFRAVTPADGLPGRSAHGLSVDGRGRLWAAFGCDGLARLDAPGAGGQVTVWSAATIGGCPWTVLARPDGGAWVGTFDGPLVTVSPDGTVRPSALPVDGVVALFVDREGRLWIGSRTKGCARYEALSETRLVGVGELPSQDVRGFSQDAAGRVWIATSKGVAVWSDGRVQPRLAGGIPAVPVRSLLADEDQLWVGTSGAGLLVRDGPRVSSLGRDRGLQDNVVSWVGREGDWIWWTGNQGIFRARRAELLRAAADGGVTVHPQRFTLADGLPSNEANGGVQPAAWKDPSGRLWFPMIDGLASVDPAALLGGLVAPRAFLERVLVDGREARPNGVLQLPADVRHIEVEYSAPALLAPQRVRFVTRLDGLDGQWVPGGGRRRVQYSRLRPGRYTLRVAAVSDTDPAPGPAATLEIEQLPAFHESWLFRLAVLLSVAGATALVVLARSAALRRRSERLESLVTSRTSELVRANADLARTKSDLEQAVVDLDRLASTDKLTGAWNRRHLEVVARGEMSRAARNGSPLTLIALDVDRFKVINDERGHQTGDRVLAELCRRAATHLRPSDVLTRMGGEEFLVLLPETPLASAVSLAERIRVVVRGEPVADAGTVTVSLGVAEWRPGETLDAWVARADQALYAAKRSGRDQVLWDPGASAPPGGAVVRTAPWARPRWRESHACGEPTVDGQHRELVERASALIALAAEGGDGREVEESLDALLEHVRFHFATEEEILARSGYDGLAGHRALHQDLLERAAALRAELREGRTTLDRLLWFVSYEVVAWHLLTADREFFHLFARPGVPTGPAEG